MAAEKWTSGGPSDWQLLLLLPFPSVDGESDRRLIGDGVTHFSGGGRRLRGGMEKALFEGCWWGRAWSEMASFGLTIRAVGGARLAGAWVFWWF